MSLQACELEQGRKESEELSLQLRSHMDSLAKQYSKIRDQVPMPSATTERQYQDENYHDGTLDKELGEIRSQLEEATNM